VKIYHVNYELDYEGSTTILITENFDQAKSAFIAAFDKDSSYITADRKCFDTWENGECVDRRDFPFEEVTT
jgi:hypothetical protein